MFVILGKLLIMCLSLPDAAGDIHCPGRQVSYSCSDITAHIWTGSAFSGMCPSAEFRDGIILTAAARTVGDELECGMFNATVTNITDLLGSVRRIASELAFTPTPTMPINGTTVVCQDAGGAAIETHTINILGEETAHASYLQICCIPQSDICDYYLFYVTRWLLRLFVCNRSTKSLHPQVSDFNQIHPSQT